ncbi:MAG: hypothetical protein IPP29_21895 [Bacteroidetes bacterium]|nr:hypothetical protein [Bacteroidota bacterium]
MPIKKTKENEDSKAGSYWFFAFAFGKCFHWPKNSPTTAIQAEPFCENENIVLKKILPLVGFSLTKMSQ